MRKKRIMVIGPTNCGKTSLVNALNDDDRPIRKTQNIIYRKNTMDVPGSYIENAWMYKYLISASQDASLILLLVDQAGGADVYSPGFAKVFRCPVLGVIAKTDLAPENEESCIRQLRLTGALEPFYKVSVTCGTGLDQLKERLINLEDR